MSGYIGIGSKSRNIPNMYIGVSSKARQVQKAYIGVNGVARLWYQRGTPIGDLAVGSTVKIAIDSVYYDFIVVHQGNPDTSIYDSSCNGTWLLMKDIYIKRAANKSSPYSESHAVYYKSDVKNYLENTFYNLIDNSVASLIKEVKIPYRDGANNFGSSTKTLSDGLATKIFLLSSTETNQKLSSSDSWRTLTEGAPLSYFDSDDKRIAYYNGEADIWYLRSPTNQSGYVFTAINTNGKISTVTHAYSPAYGVRPAFVLSQDVLVDDDGYIVN